MVIHAHNLSKSYNKMSLFKDISFDINEGDRAVIRAASGCGKTTLLNILAGIIKPDEGYISLDEKPISDFLAYRREVASYVPCGNVLLDSMPVFENVQLVSKDEDNIKQILRDLNVWHIRKSYPKNISSGEYKRVCIARAIASDTPFIFLDEPTSNLDDKNAMIVFNYLSTLKQGLVIATHDPRIAFDNEKKIYLRE